MHQPIEIVGERAGTRTQDLLIKSQMLYRLSYALPWPKAEAGPRMNEAGPEYPPGPLGSIA